MIRGAFFKNSIVFRERHQTTDKCRRDSRRKLIRISARGSANQIAVGAFKPASHDLRDRGRCARHYPEFYLCATSGSGFGTSFTKLSVAQEPAAQVIGVSNFVGLRSAPSVDREIIGQLPSGF